MIGCIKKLWTLKIGLGYCKLKQVKLKVATVIMQAMGGNMNEALDRASRIATDESQLSLECSDGGLIALLYCGGGKEKSNWTG